MNKQTVLIADIIQSRKSDDRYEIQKKLLTVIDFLNKVYKDSLVKKVEISSGDSFQGLFHNPGVAFLYIRIAQMLLYPTKIRAGIGVGDLDYIDKDFGSNLLDGEAYHNAKDAINLISGSRKEMVSLQIKNADNRLLIPLNIMLDMYYKLRQSFGVNSLRISLVNELLNPMSINGDIHYLKEASDGESEFLNNIIKSSFVRKLPANALKSSSPASIILNAKKIEPFILSGYRYDEKRKLHHSDFVLRGIQDDVANIIGTTRQNVQKYYSKGVSDERMYTFTLVNFMNEVVR